MVEWSNDTETLPLRPFCRGCIIATRGYDFRKGEVFTEDSIGMTLATRDLLTGLRSAGEITGGPKPFCPQDRSRFLSARDQAIVRLKRAGFGRTAG